MMEDFIIKYLWGALGLILCSVPVFFTVPGTKKGDLGARAEGNINEMISPHKKELIVLGAVLIKKFLYSYVINNYNRIY